MKNKLDGGTVAKMVRDYEANKATPAPQKGAETESETLSSSKLPAQQGNSLKTPLTTVDKTMEQFYSSLLQKVRTYTMVLVPEVGGLMCVR